MEGNFLIFSDTPIEKEIVYSNVPLNEFESIKSENILLKAQNHTLIDRTDFLEGCLAEMAMLVYQ